MIVAKRRVVRVSTELHHTGRNFVVRIDPGARTISVKLKGCRTWYSITVKQLYTMGGWNRAAELRRERKAKREAAKAARG